MARVLVTGGSGFLGCVLVEELRAAGHRVRVLDLFDAPSRPKDVEFVQGDIRDASRTREACEGREWVLHAVAQVPVAKNPAEFWSVNRDGTRILLEAARSASAKKVVYISSSAVFGAPPRNPVVETDEPRPAEDYGAAKLAGEGLCREASAAGLDVSILRPRTLLGPGRLGIFQLLFEWVREGSNVPVLGKGDNVYQFVDVRDFAEAARLAAARPGPGLYHVGAEKFGTMRETLQALCDHAKTGSRVKGVPAWPGELFLKVAGGLGLSPTGPYHALMYGRSLYFDISKAKSELGWSPRRSNAEALIDSYEWYLARRDEVLSADRGSAHQRKVAPKLLDLARRFL